ncbi:MAG: Ig-like domain-containing protein, partial [Gemmatimonadetes bacterium]|nr:Ig-like domain-containing protein [Gemmatimonadota bacterium]
MRAAALLCLLASGPLACARPFAPPGGERDVSAPRLLTTVPEPLTVVDALSRPAVFRFDERISEQGFSEALVSVSPLDSTLRVDRSGAEVRVSIDGGWRPNRVYRVVLLPGVRDLFGNQRSDPVELIFSTGAPIGNTALAGMVLDRLTAAPAMNGVVDAVHRTEGARYTAIADSSGFYSLRYLPVGEYDVRAYDDRNRNRRRDTLEPVDSGHTAVFVGQTDTVALVFNVLTPDTTAPRIVSASSLDSLHIQIEVDDYFDPADALDGVGAEVHVLPDSTSIATHSRILTRAAFTAEQQARRQAAEAARVAADTAGAAADTGAVRVPPPPDPAQPNAGAAALPIREFVVRLNRPLPPGSYTITISGVVNLHALVGGGVAPFQVSAPPDTPAPAPPGSQPVPPDPQPVPDPPATADRPAAHGG